MIRNTNLKLAELERSKTLEHSKLQNQHTQKQKIVDEFEIYRKNPLNHFKNQAELEIDGTDPDYWTRIGGVMGRDSLEAQRIRKEDVEKLATSRKNALFSKMGYRTKEDGVYEIDENTNLPKILTQDDPKTENVNEREVRKSKILRKQTIEEVQKPFNDYYAAQQQVYIQPKNISWAGDVIDRASSFFRKNKGEPTAIEKDAANLLTTYNDNYKAADVSISDDLVPLTVNGKSIYELIGPDKKPIIPKPFGYKKTLKADLSFTLEEARLRIHKQSNADLPATEKRAIVKALENMQAKAFITKGIELKDFRISDVEFQAKVLTKKENYNAYIAQLGERLEAFDKAYTKDIEPRTLANFKIDLKTINPETKVVYENAELWFNNTIKMSVEERQESMKTWNKTQKRVWTRYKYGREDASMAYQGLGQDPIKTRMKNINLLMNRYEANEEAKDKDQPIPYSGVELRVLKNAIVDLSESDISKAIAARVQTTLSDENTKANRASYFAQNKSTGTVRIYSMQEERFVDASSEEEWAGIIHLNALLRAKEINKVVFEETINIK